MKYSITTAGLTAEPGTKVQGFVSVPETKEQIPVTIINGREDGKIFLATAGIHGCEYPGILAAAQLAEALDPEQVSGAVILVHCVNMSSFLGRQPYVCAADENRKNLNRLFPSDGTGTVADLICRFLTEEFVRQCDFHVDLHSGDMVEELEACLLIANTPDPEQKAMLTDAAKHTRFRWRMNSCGRKEFYNSSAIDFGKPSLLFERGGAGAWSYQEAEDDMADLISLMQYLKILPEVITLPVAEFGQGEGQKTLTLDFQKSLNTEQQFFVRHEWTGAEEGDDGFLIPFVSLGEDIREGQKLFEIRDVFGRKKREIRAKHDGHIVIISRTLSVHAGDDLITYGEIEKK